MYLRSPIHTPSQICYTRPQHNFLVVLIICQHIPRYAYQSQKVLEIDLLHAINATDCDISQSQSLETKRQIKNLPLCHGTKHETKIKTRDGRLGLCTYESNDILINPTGSYYNKKPHIAQQKSWTITFISDTDHWIMIVDMQIQKLE